VALAICVAVPARGQAPPADGVSLTQAIALALAREPATRSARADVEMARAMRVQAGLRANPTMSLEQRQEPGGSDKATEIGVELPLELFRRGPRVAVAEAVLRVAEFEESDLRRQLSVDVAAVYGEVAAADRQLAILDEVLAVATKQLELLRARATQGAVPTLDRDMVDVEVRRIQAERLVHVGRADRALVRLKRLLALPFEAPLRAAQPLDELVAAFAAGDPPAAVRPDILVAQARVRVEEQRLEVARNEGRTDVTVFASYMRMDAGFPQRGFGPGGGLERVRGQFNYLTAGAMVTLPLWNRQQGTIAAALAARQGAEARLEAVQLTAAAEAAEARAWYEQARRAVSLYADGMRPLARRNLDTVRETYELGRATIADVLAEQRRYLDVERAYTDALVDAYASGVSLRRATGELR
jgi:cobalt-zinc-cadmium efflux system outer membrane protein